MCVWAVYTTRRNAEQRDATLTRETMGNAARHCTTAVVATPLVNVLKLERRSMFMQHAIKRSLLLSSRCNIRDRQWRSHEGVSTFPRGVNEDGEGTRTEGSGFVVPLYYTEFRRFTDGGLVCWPTNPRLERLFKRELRF